MHWLAVGQALVTHFAMQAVAAGAFEVHLTATILGTEEDLAQCSELIAIVERKVRRLLFNGSNPQASCDWSMCDDADEVRA